MIVHTRSGSIYEFRYSGGEEGILEGRRSNPSRQLHMPVEEWTPLLRHPNPIVGRGMTVAFAGMEELHTTLVEEIDWNADCIDDGDAANAD